MATVEARVLFRNRMGGTTTIKAETAKGIEQFQFHRAILGDQVYEDLVRTLELDQVIRVETEVVEHPRLGPVREVLRFVDAG